MKRFQRFYLDKEKDIIVDLYTEGDTAPETTAGLPGAQAPQGSAAAPENSGLPGASAPQGSDTATDLGDYLLASGRITREEYDRGQEEAKKLIAEAG